MCRPGKRKVPGVERAPWQHPPRATEASASGSDRPGWSVGDGRGSCKTQDSTEASCQASPVYTETVAGERPPLGL